MKQTLLTLAFVMAGLAFASAQQPHFFVICQANGDTARKYAGSFERVMASYLSETFPCATVKTQGDLENRIGMERINQLLGYESNMDFCKDLQCDYLLNLELSDYLSDQMIVSASVLYFRKATAMARAASYGSRNYASIRNMVNSVSKTLCERLSRYEICPFTGPVHLSITSTLDTTSIEEYGVYCNQTDQRFKKTDRDNRKTVSDWQLQREGIPATTGTMNFTMSEEISTLTEDGCHSCSGSQREAGRIYSKSRSFTISGSGISHLSSRNGNPQEDTRIELKFLSTGMYYILIKGTSDPATGDEKVTESAEGSCDNIARHTNKEPREATVPVNVIFGPYTGKTTDKVLSQKDTKTVRNRLTNETEIITIDFTLTQ